ncbi:unnamed protein product [Rotaria sp. Silwood1]|nr:unnamed protein product [Rotaria sp. Silwood1]
MMIDMTLKQMELQQTSQHQEIILSNGDNLSSLSSISLNNEEKVPTNVNATVPIAATITLEFKVENNPNSEISIISQGTRIIENSILLKTNLIENNSNVLFVLVYTLLYLIILIEDVEPTFMMKDNQNQVNEDRIILKQQNVAIRHLYSLLSYNQKNRIFIYLPTKIRIALSLNDFPKFKSIIAFKWLLNSIMKEKSEKQQLSNITEDTLGGQLKFGLAKYLALEFTVVKHFVDCIDCIDRIRFLSRLMIGSLKHAAITRNKGRIICHRISVVASQLITDYILYISTSFANQSKTSVIHLSLLFHSFILCQLWTMYCEQVNYGYDRESFVEIMNF